MEIYYTVRSGMDRDFENLVEAMPLPTELQRKRDTLIGRLARALEDMSETFASDPAMRLEAVGWTDSADFEHLLDAWETGG